MVAPHYRVALVLHAILRELQSDLADLQAVACYDKGFGGDASVSGLI